MTDLATRLTAPTGRPVATVPQRFGARTLGPRDGAFRVTALTDAAQPGHDPARDRRISRAGGVTEPMRRGLAAVAAGRPVQRVTRDALIARGLVGADADGRLHVLDGGGAA